MISVVNISKSFGSESLFDEISFDLNPGERIGLVGRNGHGKTTLLRVLAGILEPADAACASIPRRDATFSRHAPKTFAAAGPKLRSRPSRPSRSE
ncbi:MAG: ATP-binding cassette domain-containing protein [Desulfosudaceae bacterium]